MFANAMKLFGIKFNTENEEKACIMLNYWTIKWKMKLNVDASKGIYTEKEL